MKYVVNEKKFYKIEDISNINDFSYQLIHLESTVEFEKYMLEVSLKYLDKSLNEIEKEFDFPIDLNTTLTEQLSAKINKIDVEIIKDKGIELDISLDIETIIIDEIKDEIKENYQLEMEVKLEKQREELIEEVIEELDDEINPVIINSSESSDESLFGNLKSEYAKYKIITLDDSSLDKISAKYNLSINYLYDAKKNNNKVIVYDKE
jgi:hypothetical protein